MSNIIPRSFKLYGQDIIVRKSKVLESRDGSLGEAAFKDNSIVLQENGNEQIVEITFFHELVHFILFMMESKLYTNERHVEHFGKLLHQYIVSAGYVIRKNNKDDGGIK